MMRKLIFVIAGFFFAVVSTKANDIYIAQNATGAANGADCADAKAVSFFNTSGNWGTGASQIGPGTTVHLCGTFTASAGASGYLTFQGSGTSGNPITLRFETGSSLQAPYWNGGDLTINGAILISSRSYITIDGNSTGLIEATLNGTPGAACPGGACTQHQASGTGVFINTSSFIEVKNLTIGPMYLRTSSTDDIGGGISQPYGIEVLNSNNVTIDGNTLHDMNTPIYPVSTATLGPNLSFNGNNIYNANCAICGGSGNSSVTIQGPIYYFNNTVHDFTAWDSGAPDYFHHDGFDLWNVHSGATFTGNWFVYNNTVSGLSNNVNCTGDAYMDMETTPATAYGVTYVFNNVFLDGNCDDGTVYDKSGRGIFYNNTFPTAGGNNYVLNNGPASPGAPAFVNNILGGTNYAYEVDSATPSSSDYNDDVNNVTYQYHGSADSLATMRGLGFETNTITAAPNLNSSYVPNSGSPVIGKGKNLYSVCNGQPNPGLGALCYDKAGVARPTTAAWDMGALQSGSSTSSNAPNPPSGLSATVN